jgi:hypothetical protein
MKIGYANTSRSIYETDRAPSTQRCGGQHRARGQAFAHPGEGGLFRAARSKSVRNRPSPPLKATTTWPGQLPFDLAVDHGRDFNLF